MYHITLIRFGGVRGLWMFNTYVIKITFYDLILFFRNKFMVDVLDVFLKLRIKNILADLWIQSPPPQQFCVDITETEFHHVIVKAWPTYYLMYTILLYTNYNHLIKCLSAAILSRPYLLAYPSTLLGLQLDRTTSIFLLPTLGPSWASFSINHIPVYLRKLCLLNWLYFSQD